MFEKFTLDAVLAVLKRAWPLLVSVTLVVMLLITRSHLTDARTELKHEAEFRQVMQVELGAPKSDGPTLIQVARATVTESKNRKVTLERISTEAVTAKKRADVADLELKRAQTANTKKFVEAQKVIKDLQNRKPTGNWPKDYQAIEQDSQAAWKGWKK